MRRTAALLAFALCAFAALARPSCAHEPDGPTCALSIELVDRATNETLPGIVQARDASGEIVEIPELINRGEGIERRGPIHDWWVLPKARTVTVHATQLTIAALAGLESELAEKTIDLTGQSHAAVKIALERFHDARGNHFLAGNTHLHLMKLSRAEADQYLKQVPLADGLDIVFLSYLERAEADLEYTSNKYSQRELAALSHGHLHFGHGEEHRHNFGTHGEGYGHILLLDIPHIVRPVSIGPGITRQGTDAPPLQVGIDQARRSGGKVVWAHNLYGFEDIPNWITGRVHANNIFDGSAHGSYKDTYYRYLNIGLRVPFSTGTDWFIYDFSRAYVMADPERPITPSEWLDRLAAGKTYITNGPLLGFTVDQQPSGSVIDLEQPRSLNVRARARGRTDFKRVELVRDGRVVGTAASRAEGKHFVAEMDAAVDFEAPAWLALRTPPPPVENDPELQEPVGKNEFGGALFSHTSPIYIQMSGQGIFDVETARGLVAEMKSDLKKIEAQAVFANTAEKESVMGVYKEAISVLEKRLESSTSSQ
jgi:hypothetical protein